MAQADTKWWKRNPTQTPVDYFTTSAEFRFGTISIRMRRNSPDNTLKDERFNIFLSPAEARNLGAQLLKHAETYEKGVAVGFDKMINANIAGSE